MRESARLAARPNEWLMMSSGVELEAGVLFWRFKHEVKRSLRILVFRYVVIGENLWKETSWLERKGSANFLYLCELRGEAVPHQISWVMDVL